MYLAIREMRFAKVRYSLIAVIMLLVAFLVLFVTGLARGLAYDNAASIQNMDATHFMMEKDSNRRFTRSQLSGQVLVQAGSIAGLQNVQPLGVKMTTVTAEGTAKQAGRDASRNKAGGLVDAQGDRRCGYHVKRNGTGACGSQAEGLGDWPRNGFGRSGFGLEMDR